MALKPRRTGVAELWLVSGGVPHFKEMVALARPISAAVVNEFGSAEFIRRLSDPCWFSCLSTTLGFEWNTSGQTTVTLAALKQALAREEIGVKLVGGKGLAGKAVPQELEKVLDGFGLSTKKIEETKYASRISAKVDSAALQDLLGQIYCHALAIDEKANWTVVQQKMCVPEQKARRYHWLSTEVKDYVEEPHSGIIGSRQEVVLDLTARESRRARESVTSIAKEENPAALNLELQRLQKRQAKLTDFTRLFQRKLSRIPFLEPPKKFNVNVLNAAREAEPKDFKALLALRGMGAATIRGLSYLSALLYGVEPSWSDPAKFEWAFGTKTGRPFYFEKPAAREAAGFLRRAVEEARLGRREKLDALRRLNRFFFSPAR